MAHVILRSVQARRTSVARLLLRPFARAPSPEPAGVRLLGWIRGVEYRRLVPRLWSWFRRALGWWFPVWFLAVTLAAAALAFSGWWLDPFSLASSCKAEPLGCEISVDLVAALLIGSVGYFTLFFWQRNQALGRYLDRASTTPAWMFHAAGTGSEDSVVESRDRARDEVIDAVNSTKRPDPIVVVGDDGVGKTAFLVAIMKKLGERKWSWGFVPPAKRVPVPLALGAGDSIGDLEALARKSFLDEVAHMLDSSHPADVIWRKVRRSLGVVILVDGLEDVKHVSKDVRDDRLRNALRTAKDNKIAVVLTVSSRALPEIDGARLEPLGHFDQDELRIYLEERLRRNGAEARRDRSRPSRFDRVLRLAAQIDWPAAVPGRRMKQRREAQRIAELEEARLKRKARSLSEQVIALARRPGLEDLRSPFYLDVVATVGLDDAPVSNGGCTLQRDLLDRYADEIDRRAITNGMTESALVRMRDALEVLAPQMLMDDGELDPASIRDPEGPLSRSRLARDERGDAIAAARDLGFLQSAGRPAPITFRHASLNAYFAACRFEKDAYAEGKPSWLEALDCTTSEWLMLALALFAAKPSVEQSVAEDVCRELVTRTDGGRDADHDLRLARAAAKIARARNCRSLYPDIAQAASRTKATDRRQKLGLFRLLSELDDEHAYRTLFSDAVAAGPVPIAWGDFVLRWAASKHLVLGRHVAYRAIADEVESAISEAERTASAESERKCAIVGWLLPGMRLHDGSKTDAEIEVHLDRLLALALDEVRFDPTGIQNALARGLKIDALSRETPTVDPLARDRFLPYAGFWHARICLVHAIAIPCFDLSTYDETAFRRLVRIARSDLLGSHPMVRQAARLCLEGIGVGARERYIWEAEGHATSQVRDALTDETAQLVADVAILMNLIYSKKAARPLERMDDRVVTGIPHCLTTSKTRGELFKGCTCEFGLCPFPESSVREMGRGEVSQAFCSRQSAIARKGVPPWQRRMGRGKLAKFWKNMERENAAKRPLIEWWETMTPPRA